MSHPGLPVFPHSVTHRCHFDHRPVLSLPLKAEYGGGTQWKHSEATLIILCFHFNLLVKEFFESCFLVCEPLRAPLPFLPSLRQAKLVWRRHQHWI